jgi:hypothetical protein
MGPWTYDFFLAQNYDNMDSYLVGTRITLRPFRLLEIGLTRTAQWGGEGRPQSALSFVHTLFGVGINGNTAQEQANDPANELAGYDLRLRCGWGLRCALYAQWIGEDATHHVPSDYLDLYGIEGWSPDGRYRWYAEFVETLCGATLEHDTIRDCAYRNHAYPEGYTHLGRWIGASAGADSRVLTLGWLDVENGTTLRLHSGRIGARIGVFAPVDDPRRSGRVLGLGARQAWTLGRVTLGAEFDAAVVDAPLGPSRETRLGVNLHVPF